MTTDRPYRRALPIQVALQEMRACAGTQFDPRVVEALVGLVERWEPELVEDVAPSEDLDAALRRLLEGD
jgi:HD-GYP domain-containing protein (c-di-GMP phosphodiesterase class II)